MTILYKICPVSLWREAETAGAFLGSAVDLRDGFIHLSAADQAEETAARHFAGQRDLVLLAIDGEQLGESLKWETSRGGSLFPHLYGVLPVAAVVSVAALPLGEDGRHIFPPLKS